MTTVQRLLSVQSTYQTLSPLVVLSQVHLPAELCPPLCDQNGCCQVEDHCQEYYQTKPVGEGSRFMKQGITLPNVELDTEVDDGDGNIDKGGYDGEDQVLEEIVDGAGSSVHHPEHLPGLAGQVPLQAQLVDVSEQRHLQVWRKGPFQDSDMLLGSPKL